MASNFTLKISSVCAGGEHVTLQLYKDAAAVKKIMLNKSDIIEDDTKLDDAIIFLCKKSIQLSGATTNAQRKAAIEGMVITL